MMGFGCMKRSAAKAVFAALALLMVLGCFARASAEEERRVVRVAFPEQTGMSGIDDTGKLEGYNYDYLEKISEFTGWKMEYITYPATDANDAVMNAMQDIEDGKVDLLGPMLKNDATVEMYEYPENNYGTVYTMLCVGLDSTLHRSGLDLNRTYKVGLFERAAQRNSEVIAYLESDNIPYELVYYPNVKEQLNALRTGEVDMVSAVSLSPYDNTRMFAKFAPRPYYFVSTKGNSELIRELDRATAQVSAMHPNLQDELFERYFASRVDYFALSPKDRETLLAYPTLRVLAVDKDAPYVFIENGVPKGALVTVVNEFAKAIGSKVEYTACTTRAEAEAKIADGAFDIVIGVPFPSDFCSAMGYIKSDAVFTSGLSFIRSDYFSGDDSDATLAVVRGTEGYIDTAMFGKVVTYETMGECVSAVQRGKVAAAAGNQSSMEHYLNENGSTLLSFSMVDRTYNVGIAVSRKTALPLLGILNRFVASFSVAEKNMILSEGNTHDNFFRVLYAARRFLIRYPWTIALAVAAIVLAICLRGRKIKKEKLHLESINRQLEEARKTAETAMVQLEKAGKAKTNFLFNMSHDIRTPMNAILGYSELIKRKLTDPELQDYQQKIEDSGNLLLSIINNVLDMARIESGNIELNEEIVDTRATMGELMSVFEKIAENKQIEIVTDWNTPHRYLVCDQLKIKEIFLNLLSNAVKYTQPGGKVYAGAEEIPCGREGYVRIRSVVEDNGIGMSEEFLPHLFDAFSRERNTTTGKVVGTGLGMPIVKKLVELMGGTIEVESTLGKGTKFTVVLEHKLADPAECAPKDVLEDTVKHEVLHGKRILLAEDNELNAEIAKIMLEGEGFLVDHVEDGILCVEKVKAMPAGTYDVILMDVQMPNMDGYRATEEIRKLSDHRKANIPIIAMTANAFEEDKKNAFAAGMNGHLAKPIDLEKIEKTIYEVLTGNER
ncbi:MAG: transporter substrate-binding domain-containing protein [Clostridia bacterium]|nr:transporter substrate-binding domain-containing protein [Clostridia bacterium]